jgi:SOS-response transcriptional repressor LexA
MNTVVEGTELKHGMTPRQKTVLDYVRDYIELHEYSPSMREISENCDLHLSGVARVLNSLEKRKRISRLYGVSRSLVVLD